MPGKMKLSDLIIYLGHMEADQIIALVQAGDLPSPIMGVKPTCRLALWDQAAVDRALDATRARKMAKEDSESS